VPINRNHALNQF